MIDLPKGTCLAVSFRPVCYKVHLFKYISIFIGKNVPKLPKLVKRVYIFPIKIKKTFFQKFLKSSC